jgi:hypothetical protein
MSRTPLTPFPKNQDVPEGKLAESRLKNKNNKFIAGQNSSTLSFGEGLG